MQHLERSGMVVIFALLLAAAAPQALAKPV
jgi:hypothetical protein